MQVVFLVFLFVLGSCFGSFLCCQARRLRLRETKETHKIKKNQKTKKETKILKNASLGPHSVCLHCKTRLKWYDNLPILSWLFLKGKCRKCHQEIGVLELLSELGVALAFLALGTTIDITTAEPLTWAIFIMALILTLALSFLAIYDGAWGELPTSVLTFSVFCAIIVLILKEWIFLSNFPFSFELILNPVLSILIFGGTYLLLYLISKGKWVGDGDWILGVIVGLTLADPFLTLVTLFLSNFLACLVMFPTVKNQKTKKIYFGPFIVLALIIVMTFADFLKNMIL